MTVVCEILVTVIQVYSILFYFRVFIVVEIEHYQVL